jgi:SAM-dependent methyltransferase
VAGWFEDEEFWKAYASLMFDDDRWAEVPAVVDALLDRAGLPRRVAPGKRPPSVLDTCCGVGRHSIELASRGFDVTGIDITTAYLEAARESAAALEPRPVFVRADLRGFVRPAAYDLALNLFRSFGYFDDPAEDLVALRNIRASLSPGGTFILETLGKEVAALDFMEGEWFERDGWTVLTEYKVAGDWEGLVHRWVLLREGERIDRSFTLRLYSAHEIKALLHEAGFSAAEVYGSPEGGAYDETAHTMVVVAHLPP